MMLLAGVLAPAVADTQEPRSVGGELNILRWKEDYSFLRDREQPSLVERLKFIALNHTGTTYLSLGGQVRERIEDYDPASFGLPAPLEFTSYATRLLAHADLHLGGRFRTFVELGSYWEEGRKPASRPIDRGDLELQQGFVDIVALDRPGSRLTARFGRQELPLGPGRLVSIRDGANVRLSFDAAKLTWVRSSRSAIEAAAGRPVEPGLGVFDSSASTREWFWYAAVMRGPKGTGGPGFEGFYVGRSVEDALYGRGIADESRHSLGGRFWGRASRWDYSLQASYQAGSFGAADIRAWGVASEVGHSFVSSPWRPRLALRADIASGDGGDPDVLSSFNAPYPALNYFSEAAIFAPSNAFDVHPYVEARPTRKLGIGVGVDLISRLKGSDAIYRAGGGILVRPGTSGRFVTAATQVDGTWQPLAQVTFRAAWAWARAGSVIRAAGGRSITFFLVSLDLKL